MKPTAALSMPLLFLLGTAALASQEAGRVQPFDSHDERISVAQIPDTSDPSKKRAETDLWTEQNDKRAGANRQEQAFGPQISSGSSEQAAAQISRAGDAEQPVPQLSNAEMSRLLARLPEKDQRVVLEAVEGSDICENPPAIKTVIEFCKQRLETRSADFAHPREPPLSAEERLLGSGLEDDVVLGLETAIDRLARNGGKASNPDDQAIAAVALAGNPPPTAQPDDPTDANAGDVPEATQALINAIVQQVTNGGGN